MSFNPYLPFQAQAKAFLFIEGGETFLNIITTYQVLMGVSLLLTAVSIATRIYRGEKLWIIRMSNSGFCQPHYIFSTLLFSLFFIILEICCMQSIRKYASLENTERRDAIIFRSLRFLPLWFGGWMLTWATTLESVLNRPSSTSGFDLANHPRVVNAFFIFVPAFFLALSFTLMGIANHYWNESLALYNQLRSLLDQAVLDFDKGIPADILQLQGLEVSLTRKTDQMTFWWTKGNATLCSLVLFLAITFVLASFMYLRNLRSAIRSARYVRNPTADSVARLAALKNVYSSLVVTTIAVETIAINLFIVSLFVALNLAKLGIDPTLSERVNLWTYGIYPILALPLNGAVCYRSLLLLKARNITRSTIASSQQTAVSSTPVKLSSFNPASRNDDSKTLDNGDRSFDGRKEGKGGEEV